MQLGVADIEEYLALKDFDEGAHPRDEHGKFTSSGVGGGGITSPLSPHTGLPIRLDYAPDNVRAHDAGERVIFGDKLNNGMSTRGAVAAVAPDIKRQTTLMLAEQTHDIPIEDLRRTDPQLAYVYAYRAAPGASATLLLDPRYPEAPNPADYEFVRDRNDGRLSLVRMGGGFSLLEGERAYPLTDEHITREYAMSQIVDRWAMTANDNRVESLALQNAAERVFGVKDAASWQTGSPSILRGAEQEADANAKVYDRVLREMYDASQEHFKELGITEMQLYRGVGYPRSGDERAPTWLANAVNLQADMPGGRQPISIQQVPLRPLSSFTSDYDTARRFASTGLAGPSAVIGATVPVERILSFPGTGLGAAREFEFVVIGGTDPFTVDADPGSGREFDD